MGERSDFEPVLPIQYGKARLAGNLADYADFTPEKRTDPTPNADRYDVLLPKRPVRA